MNQPQLVQPPLLVVGLARNLGDNLSAFEKPIYLEHKDLDVEYRFIWKNITLGLKKVQHTDVSRSRSDVCPIHIQVSKRPFSK